MVLRILTAHRLRVYPLAVLIGASLGFAIFIGASSGLHSPRGGRVGGDFPAFYGAARLLQRDGLVLLYDPAAQRRAQADIMPEDGWIHFPYPPFVALAYVPFTLVSFKIAYVAHAFLMAGCCVLSLRLLRRALPQIGDEFWPIAAAILTFYPLFLANVGGQNTAVSLLCVSAAAVALAKGRPVAAGVWLGAWMFKPQLALPVVVAVSFVYPRILPGVAVSTGVWYLVGAMMAGLAWPLWWIREGVLPFAVSDVTVDRGNGVSLVDLAREFNAPVAGLLFIVVVMAMIVATRRGRRAPVVFTGLATAAAMLVSPHALYYDGGLAVLGLVGAGVVFGASFLPYATAAWLVAALQPLRDHLPLPPLTVVLLAVLFSTSVALRRLPRDGDGARPREMISDRVAGE